MKDVMTNRDFRILVKQMRDSQKMREQWVGTSQYFTAYVNTPKLEKEVDKELKMKSINDTP